jgi:hypothetical protein
MVKVVGNHVLLPSEIHASNIYLLLYSSIGKYIGKFKMNSNGNIALPSSCGFNAVYFAKLFNIN